MTETQLIYFTTIIEIGSFSEAALELNISQSSISKQIMQLEDELGILLFDRSSRKAKLTSAGDHLYQDAKNVLSQIKHMKYVASQFAEENRKKLRLLALPVIGHYNFYVPIKVFETSHIDYSVELEEMEEPEMYRRINSGDYDAAITYFNPNQHLTNATFYPLFDDEMILVCHKEHPLGKQKTVSPKDLDDVSAMAMPKYTCVSQLYDLYFQKHNSNPRVIFRGRPETIIIAAEAERGVSLLTRVHADVLRTSGLSLVPFSPQLKGILGIIVNNNKVEDPYMQELVKSLTNI